MKWAVALMQAVVESRKCQVAYALLQPTFPCLGLVANEPAIRTTDHHSSQPGSAMNHHRSEFSPAFDDIQDLRIATQIGRQIDDQLDDLIEMLAVERADSVTNAWDEIDEWSDLLEVGCDSGIQADDDTRALSHEASERSLAVDFSFVLPCLNQAHELADSILRIQFAVERIGRRGEVFVVDFGSSDDSVQIAEELGARVIERRGESLTGLERLAGREVLAAARGQVVVLTDCRPETIDRWF